MATPESAPVFLLMWHPGSYHWEEDGYGEAIRITADGGTVPDDWTVGTRKGGINPGDRVFLYRMYRDRGLVASGIFTSEVYQQERWDGSGRIVGYADLKWETVLDYQDRLPFEELKASIPGFPWDHIQGSGWQVRDPVRKQLSDLWTRHVHNLRGRCGFRRPTAHPESARHPGPRSSIAFPLTTVTEQAPAPWLQSAKS